MSEPKRVRQQVDWVTDQLRVDSSKPVEPMTVHGDLNPYVEQIERMASSIRLWLNEHSKADVKIQFNYPRHIAVAMTLANAHELKFISCNFAGYALLKHVEEHTPGATATMLRIAMEVLGKS